MIRVRTLGDWDLPWCEWTWVESKYIFGIDVGFYVLIGEEYQPSEFKEPHLILLDKTQATEENPYAGDFCYISINELKILKGGVDIEQFNLIKKWIVIYQEAIIDIWNGNHDTVKFMKVIGKKYD